LFSFFLSIAAKWLSIKNMLAGAHKSTKMMAPHYVFSSAEPKHKKKTSSFPQKRAPNNKKIYIEPFKDTLAFYHRKQNGLSVRLCQSKQRNCAKPAAG